ncbi:ABC transporter ATP-binding protein [Spiroplasma litorale]|uniref:ABC transporter ATP-binding protein n=1 Tax=Spiroplasma litorale TaxID=216942 RepID=A0A0K1W0G8_9MOLU|nr:ABC transporter ATP-binding protein [Spiroplasma litorale]AKX33794.1 ABC transporter ATP-binding protein [Spiroplasma litorale]
MIVYKNVSLMYSVNTGIKNFNLEIKDNEKVAIIGPNGSGKTTLLKITLGFSKYYKGEVLIKEVSNKDNKFNLNNIGYVSSENIFPSFSKVKTIVNLYKKLKNDENNKLDYISKLLKINLKEKKYFKSLSTGMIQKVKLCLALSYDNDYYIFDEPTNGLDAIIREKTLNYIYENLKQKTIIYCTHLIEEITTFFDRLIIIKDNTIKLDVEINEKTNVKNIFYEVYGEEIND